MKKYFAAYGILVSVIAGFSILSLGCPSNNPSSPQAPTPTPIPPCVNASNTPCTATRTPTNTPTTTPTGTPTCVTVQGDITSNINGADVSGDNTTHTPSIDLEGYGPYADIWTFTIAVTTTLNFSTCPTEDASKDNVMWIRKVCWDSTTDVAFNDDSCDLLAAIYGVTLPPGTYYVFVAAYQSGDQGAYKLRVKSGTASTIYAVTPVATPQVAVEPNDSFGQAMDLGGGTPVPTGQKIATGTVNDGGDLNDFFSFVPANGGTAAVTLDGFDNGMSSQDFDLYGFNSTPTQIASSTSTNPVETINFAVTAGQTYYLQVNAYFGSGGYRLTLHTP